MKRLKLYRRRFLNRPRYQSTALVIAELETDHAPKNRWVPKGAPKKPPLPQTQMTANLTLADCNRQITLEFSAGSDDHWGYINNVGHKSMILREAVNAFLDKVDQGLDQVRYAKDDAIGQEMDEEQADA